MGNPYLNRDESIILTTHNVIFNSIVTEVIFTNQRLILFDSRHAQFRYQTIPLATIETVMIREDAESNPVIFLSIAPITPDSPPQSKELTFSKQASGDRKQECVDWVKQLKEQITAVRQQELTPPQPAPYHETDIIFDDITPDETELFPAGSPLPETRTEPHEPIMTPPLKRREKQKQVLQQDYPTMQFLQHRNQKDLWCRIQRKRHPKVRHLPLPIRRLPNRVRQNSSLSLQSSSSLHLLQGRSSIQRSLGETQVNLRYLWLHR